MSQPFTPAELDAIKAEAQDCVNRTEIMVVIPSQVLRLVEQARPMEWQPISTAPKDTEVYILVFPALIGVPLVVSWDRELDYWRVALTQKKCPCKPSHWMPIPKPPEAK